MYKYLIPFLAIAGALFGLVVVQWSQKTVPVPLVIFPPASSPYAHSIAGVGIVEASSQNISIGTPFNEVIDKVFVEQGDLVQAGDPLFQLDLRNLKAQLETAKANLKVVTIDFENKKMQFSFFQRLQDKKSVSEQIYQQSNFALKSAEESVKAAEATVAEIEINIQRSIIKAPIDGKILQVNSHVGEIAPIIPFISGQSTWRTAKNGTLILMGRVDPLQVRVDIDEDDAWRYEAGARATAFVRGNRNISFPVFYQRTEHYIIPKSSFTGETVERVDTRVLQVLYQFEKKDLPVYPGQILDLFIESQPLEKFLK